MTRILLAGADVAVVRFAKRVLTAEGFGVVEAVDAETAMATLRESAPGLAVVAGALPPDGGAALVRRLRQTANGAGVPVVLLGGAASPQAVAAALTAGADDFLATPFDSLELVARVRALLARNAELRAVSPLTGLPGSHRINAEIKRRFAAGEPLAVGYVDLDNFKAFNDRYGWMRGDEVILLLAAALRVAAASAGPPPPLLGHVGGDDFVVVSTPEQIESLGAKAIEQFDEGVVALHDAADVANGYLVVVDRRGVERRHPLATVSIGVATTRHRDYADYRDVVAVANEMKSVAKARPGSVVAVDRRADGVPAAADTTPAGVHNGGERPARSGIGESPSRR
ncbi:MAG TPA: diguanylate cyclase [Mycobacteriales bacterium]|nr:diguanylate cyclase [Mycobacteriales bacterium]